MSFTLLSSPLQGFTDYIFRNAQNRHFGGIDTFYAPYIRLNGKLEIKSSYHTDLLPENNDVSHLIPQIITNSAEEFIYVTKYVESLGYKELNWNLGCPYPMVTKKGMGSGLIQSPEKIDEILNEVHSKTNIKVSMKMRMGYFNSEEILDVFPVLEKYPLDHVAIHARIGKQLYKGPVDLLSFEKCLQSTQLPIYYNGDIVCLDSFQDRQSKFKEVNHFMMGRGLITNPFLPKMIKDNQKDFPDDRFERFKQFHDELYEKYKVELPGQTPLRMKMLSFWTYFAKNFDDEKKVFKKIKKSKDAIGLKLAANEILNKARHAENVIKV
ncbi:MAG: tRNA dihydrouridine synthase [Flavobacteriales bacterium]